MKVMHFHGLKGLIAGIILLVVIVFFVLLALNILLFLIPILIALAFIGFVWRWFRKKEHKTYVDIKAKRKH